MSLPLRQGFSVLVLGHFGPDNALLLGAPLCIVGCLAVFLASTH